MLKEGEETRLPLRVQHEQPYAGEQRYDGRVVAKTDISTRYRILAIIILLEIGT